MFSHPKYRAALQEKLPFFVWGSVEQSGGKPTAKGGSAPDAGSTHTADGKA